MVMGALRKYIGTVVAAFGFVLLCIITFGDLGEILSEQYWLNVRDNLTSIGFMSIALTMIQVSIKQGLSEQALQRGLNTEDTARAMNEHRLKVKTSIPRMIYLPYFLQVYNERHTKLRKQEYLINNNFKTEDELFASKNKKAIAKYKKIRVFLTASRIKWSTTDIVYNKYGQIITLSEYRRGRLFKGIILAFVFMIGATLLTRGLFFEETEVELWEKFVKLFGYIIIISMTVSLSMIKEYEKGAFSVPNELDEINEIWSEFEAWIVPEHVLKEVKELE